MRYKDLIREDIQKQMDQQEYQESENEDRGKETSNPTFAEEQKRIKNEFLTAAEGGILN